MITFLTKLALVDGLKVIKNTKDFFEVSKEQKSKNFETKFLRSLPKEVIDYFINTKEAEIISEIQIIMKDEPSELFKKIINFLINDFGSIIDDYYFNKSKLNQNEMSLSNFGRELITQMEYSTYNEISEKIAREIYKLVDGNIIIVESPLSLDIDLKTKIRKIYNADNKKAFVVFNVNENIFGGIKTYINGKITDDSWASKIENLEYIGA